MPYNWEELGRSVERIEAQGTRMESKVDRVDEKVDRASERIDHVAGRMDSLVDTTNHRLDEFTKSIDGKLDDGELLTSLGFKLLNNKLFRWAFGVVSLAVVGTTVWQHWVSILPDWTGF
jgi:hypothetical protein